MKAPLILTVLLLLSLAALGCGKKADDGAAQAGASSSGGATVPADLDQGPRAAEAAINDGLVDQGKGLFQTKGCSSCHSFGRRMSGPDLNGVTTRRTARWMENQILHPELMTHQDPISRQLFATYALQMPNQGLTPDQARAVIEYLKHQNHETAEKAN